MNAMKELSNVELARCLRLCLKLGGCYECRFSQDTSGCQNKLMREAANRLGGGDTDAT